MKTLFDKSLLKKTVFEDSRTLKKFSLGHQTNLFHQLVKRNWYRGKNQYIPSSIGRLNHLKTILFTVKNGQNIGNFIWFNIRECPILLMALRLMVLVTSKDSSLKSNYTYGTLSTENLCFVIFYLSLWKY